jgi:hypothetical protein
MPLTLASNAITFTDNTALSSGVIGTAQLSAGAVTADKIASLPNNIVTTASITASAITADKMSGGQSGSAPIYGCRAWFVFDATRDSSGATNQNNTNRFIYNSGNIDYIIRLSSQRYRVVFKTTMPTINYSPMINGNIGTLAQNDSYVHDWANRALSSFEIGMSYNGSVYNDAILVTGHVFA